MSYESINLFRIREGSPRSANPHFILLGDYLILDWSKIQIATQLIYFLNQATGEQVDKMFYWKKFWMHF